MNERIQELALQAWQLISDDVSHLSRIHNRTITQDDIIDVFEEKFAELIVQECAGICDSYGMPDGTSQTAMILSMAIRNRFGVRE